MGRREGEKTRSQGILQKARGTRLDEALKGVGNTLLGKYNPGGAEEAVESRDTQATSSRHGDRTTLISNGLAAATFIFLRRVHQVRPLCKCVRAQCGKWHRVLAVVSWEQGNFCPAKNGGTAIIVLYRGWGGGGRGRCSPE